MCSCWGISSQKTELHVVWNIRPDHVSAIGVLEGQQRGGGPGSEWVA